MIALFPKEGWGDSPLEENQRAGDDALPLFEGGWGDFTFRGFRLNERRFAKIVYRQALACQSSDWMHRATPGRKINFR